MHGNDKHQIHYAYFREIKANGIGRKTQRVSMVICFYFP